MTPPRPQRAGALEIAPCRQPDVADLRRFIDEKWRQGHPMAASRELLDYTYRLDDGHYAVALAKRPGTGDIVGMIAFIVTSRFDPAITERDLSFQLWKVDPAWVGKGVGSALVSYVIDWVRPRSVLFLGMSSKARQLCSRAGYTMGALRHHYVPRDGVSGFTLLENPSRAVAPLRCLSKRIVPWCPGMEIDKASHLQPARSTAYLENKYLHHPIYRYELLAVTDGGKPKGVAAVRRCEAAGACALSIVDYVGDFEALIGTRHLWQEQLERHGAEYLQLYEWGLPEALLPAAGFLRAGVDGPEIVPGYFEPLERRNVTIELAFRGPADLPCVLFRGDSDQDRPNLLAAAVRAASPSARPESGRPGSESRFSDR